jgi:hypothetical protein
MKNKHFLHKNCRTNKIRGIRVVKKWPSLILLGHSEHSRYGGCVAIICWNFLFLQRCLSFLVFLRITLLNGDSLIDELKLLSKRYVDPPKKPKVYTEHRCFINTDNFNIPNQFRPNWIGTVRDPIDRYASLYYYRSKPRTYRPGILHLVSHLF